MPSEPGFCCNFSDVPSSASDSIKGTREISIRRIPPDASKLTIDQAPTIADVIKFRVQNTFWFARYDEEHRHPTQAAT
jgi:hypothetical protein